jgi:hypothetical protein
MPNEKKLIFQLKMNAARMGGARVFGRVEY